MNPIDRRRFLKAGTGIGLALMTGLSAQKISAAELAKDEKMIHGVNLGGWLVLERWITPSLYAGVDAQDEYTLCQKLGAQKAAEHLKKHRETWITEEDFKWLAARGINAVRLPVGYGVLEDNPPFVTGEAALSSAFRAANAAGIKVLLDLHGVPGSQNGWDHSGRGGKVEWHTSKENVAHSLRIIEGLAEFCKDQPNLLGIELLNEPRKDVPLNILRSYYLDAYALVRKHLPPERAAVVFHDSFRAKSWDDFMQGPEFLNVILDTHLYQCFTDKDKQRDLQSHFELASVARKNIGELRQHHRCIVGEWSCSLPPKALRGLSGAELDAAMRSYGSAQLGSYETTNGWFFWTLRTESREDWSFRNCVERGWLPERYQG